MHLVFEVVGFTFGGNVLHLDFNGSPLELTVFIVVFIHPSLVQPFGIHCFAIVINTASVDSIELA